MTAKYKKMLMLTDGNIDNASARIRAIQYIPFLQKNNFDVKLIPRVPKKYTSLLGQFGIFPILKRWHMLKRFFAIRFRQWDIVFIQRTFIQENLLKHLRSAKTTIIYDFDDAIYINPLKTENRAKTAIMIKYANEVIVSTDYLRDFCMIHQKDPVVIPSPVETDRIIPGVKSPGRIPVIGWIGSAWTTGFLDSVEHPLKRLAREHEFKFLTVGAKADHHIDGLKHESRPWRFERENEDINEMDIGIMPLPDTEFARSKGGYKLLQYMSGGIPCVASPVGINSSIIKPGVNGYLASTDDEWYEVLEKLLNDPSLRSAIGNNGRKDAVEQYSREVCFEKLMNAISRHLIHNS